ncbi:MAG TPA: fused MFS/spermidine synthase [Candidatus Binatia bacterium]|nr:fused MFS/spermidine synthase [Candidatus Binatia bacterium]
MLAATTLVFVGGFAIMVLEIIGARYLAKDFGSSFYVWVSQIGVILIALALGYVVGGALADRWRRLTFLSMLLVPTGAIIGLIPAFAPRLIEAIISRHPTNQPIPAIWQKLDPVIGSSLVFLLPCFVLATLSPYMIRLGTRTLEHVGRMSGWIIGASTVGSIAGVFVSGYVLLDHMAVTDIFRVTGVLVTGLGVLCLVMDRWFKKVALAILLFAVASSNAEVVYETTSPHHHIKVIDQGGTRTLSFDGSMESRMSIQNPLQGHFEYTEFFHTPFLWNPLMTNVLMIGLGGGSTQRAFLYYYPQVTVQTVEIDPVVVRVAKEYFHVEETLRHIIHVEDGRVFLRRTDQQFGVIIMDAYVQTRYGGSIPYHLATKEFFELASKHLTTNGVLAYNVMGRPQAVAADVLGAMYKTLKGVFPNVYQFAAHDSLNVVLIASKSAEKFNFNTIHTRATGLIQTKRVTLPSFRGRLYSFRSDAPANLYLCKVLTDDFAPLDGLLNTGY